MKHTIQINTNVQEAEKFIQQLSSQGYTAHRNGAHVHFTDNDTGMTTIRYTVSIFEDDDNAYIGVRPI